MKAHALRYLALGDSYTIGEGVDASARWTHQLAAALRAEGIALSDPHTIATTGWTTDELSAAIDAAAPSHDWDFVSLLIGVNNQYRGGDPAVYGAEFEALLERAIQFADGRNKRVLVLSIPDWGVTAFGQASGRDTRTIAAQIDDFNAKAGERCAQHGVAFIDITPCSRMDAGDASLLADDGLHPSGAMYARWTQAALPAARALLAGAA